jgi:carboxyl-terminal processing protease
VRTRTCSAPAGASDPALPPTIGYVRVGSFSSTGAASTEFASAIQSRISAADRDGLAGWIVDLRGNGGGNMWPMIAGLGPVLGEGVLGYFIDPTGFEVVWHYLDGVSSSGGTPIERVPTPYRLRREQPNVAVLPDNAVASSGEATVIAFRARPNTRLFGRPTCGVSTANSSFPMPNGAILNLTVAVMADRTKTRYGDSVVPDEVVSDPAETVNRAVSWLLIP